jgi:hypothetical protein
MRETLERMTSVAADRVLERLRERLEDNCATSAGVLFDSRAWLITARRG